MQAGPESSGSFLLAHSNKPWEKLPVAGAKPAMVCPWTNGRRLAPTRKSDPHRQEGLGIASILDKLLCGLLMKAFRQAPSLDSDRLASDSCQGKVREEQDSEFRDFI